MTAAPHLPPRTRDMIRSEVWHLLKWVLLIVVLASLAGTSAALLVVNSWYPTATLGNTTMVYGRGGQRVAAPDAAVVRDWRGRVVRVYDESQRLNVVEVSSSALYPESAELGQAVVLSSSGWAVMLAPNTAHSRRKLTGIDVDGKSHAVEMLLPDSRRNLWYLKLSGTEFRATTVFGDGDSLRPGDSLWGLNGDWSAITVGEPESLGVAPYRAGEPTLGFGLIGTELAGRIIISPRGDFIGLASADGYLLPAWIIAATVPNILATGALDSLNIQWQGNFVVGVQELGTWRSLSGFYISDARSAGVVSALKVGDVITHVNDQKITKANLARLLLSASSQFQATVLRAGKEVNVEVIKTAAPAS